MTATIEAGAGPSADDWSPWIARLPTTPRPWPPRGALVVVAPHPDDEMLGAGGALVGASDRGERIIVLGVTAGEAAFPGLDAGGRRRLAAVRRRETATAYDRAGVRAERRELGIPDGNVAARVDGLRDAIAAALADAAAGDVSLDTGEVDRPSERGAPSERAVTCLAPWPDDGHPDHEAAGRAAAAAARRLGAQLWWYPVWAWNVHAPGPHAPPLAGARRADLDTSTAVRKRAGLAAYRSQLERRDGRPAIVPPRFLAHFQRPWEVWIPAPPPPTSDVATPLAARAGSP